MSVTLPAPIDLLHRGLTHNVGCYVVETDDGIALFDCGPTPCIPRLEAGLADRGLELGDVSHLLLSHIHFDHAGATGALVRANPSLQVHVSAVGAPHLVEPSRLEASARRLYGNEFDTLWGELAPVPEKNVHIVGPEVLGVACFPSPGHASHHVCYPGRRRHPLRRRRRRRPHPSRALFVQPPTPPPESTSRPGRSRWTRSSAAAGATALTDFGVAEDTGLAPPGAASELRGWPERVPDGSDEEFRAAAPGDASAPTPTEAEAYGQAMPDHGSRTPGSSATLGERAA